MNNEKQLKESFLFGELLGQADMHKQEIKKLEQLRLEAAKAYDELNPRFTNLTTHIIAQEKPTESFISGIMHTLVEIQSQFNYQRHALAEVEARIEIEAQMGRFCEISYDEKINKVK